MNKSADTQGASLPAWYLLSDPDIDGTDLDAVHVLAPDAGFRHDIGHAFLQESPWYVDSRQIDFRARAGPNGT